MLYQAHGFTEKQLQVKISDLKLKIKNYRRHKYTECIRTDKYTGCIRLCMHTCYSKMSKFKALYIISSLIFPCQLLTFKTTYHRGMTHENQCETEHVAARSCSLLSYLRTTWQYYIKTEQTYKND